MKPAENRKLVQTSEHHYTAMLLALVGGYLDAYSYIVRGNVFATAQTGNIVLLGIEAIEGNFKGILHYMIPIAAFAVGIFVCEWIKDTFSKSSRFHWRQLVIVIEIIGVIIVKIVPTVSGYNHIANVIISFVCALQVEAFRKVRGNAFASTMCTGNLRSATERIYRFIRTGNKKHIRDSALYYVVIFSFILGATLGAFSGINIPDYALTFPILWLLAAVILMRRTEI